MENIKFLSAENEIQKIYSNLGLIVPVGDLSTGKAPAVQPLPSTSTQDSITFNFNVMSGAEVTGIEYKVNDGEAVQVTPQKGVVSIELEELEHNSGPYEIELTVFNETGRTTVTQTADLQPFTDWAIANEVLEGNKFIGEDGQEHVGNIVTKTQSDLVVNAKTVAVPAGYYAQNAYASVSNDYIIPTGNLPITANGENIDVSQYATISVNVSSTPSSGGFVVSRCEYVFAENEGDIKVEFSARPELDYELHTYKAGIYIAGVAMYGIASIEDPTDPDAAPCDIFVELGDEGIYCQEDGPMTACLYIYEDDAITPTWVVPCQMTTSYQCNEQEQSAEQ